MYIADKGVFTGAASKQLRHMLKNTSRATTLTIRFCAMAHSMALDQIIQMAFIVS